MGKIPFRGARPLIHFVGGRNFGVTRKFREAVKSQRFNFREKLNFKKCHMSLSKIILLPMKKDVFPFFKILFRFYSNK